MTGVATLWVLERWRPAALVVAAARLAGCGGLEAGCVRRGLGVIVERAPDGWVKRNAGYLLAKREALEEALRLAALNGGPPSGIVEEVLGLVSG